MSDSRSALSQNSLPKALKGPAILTALLLAACAASTPTGSPQPPAEPPPPATPQPGSGDPRRIGASIGGCLNGLRPPALAAGIRAETWSRHTDGLLSDADVLARLDRQPEFSLPIWDYLSGLVDEERIELGQARLAEHRDTLVRISAEYGVPAEAVVAVWGVESNFGQTLGELPLVRSLATLSCLGRRQAFFRGELYATLRILQAGDVAPERLTGSWAGAFGQTQFMPTTYERLAVDYDGDGRRDLMDSAPDALASTANFLRRAGWRSGQPWGFEVRLPEGFNAAGEGRRVKRPLSVWSARGLLRADGRTLSDDAALTADTTAGLLLPAGPKGPAFLVFRNFDAFYSYNAAESYGLAIAHLSDRLRGAGPFTTAWPTDDPGLSRAQRRELQALLVRRGHDIGEVDGRLGERSRSAIRREQERLGQDATGRGGLKLLLALRGESGTS